MKQTMTALLLFLLFGYLVCFPAYAEDASNEALLQRIQRLEETQRVIPESWMDRISISGVLEAEAGYASTDFSDPAEKDTDESDAVLATMELGIDADITDHVSGHVLFLWEEDDTEPIDLDEGIISLSGGDELPIYLNVGKMYVPFGTCESTMISDPLTLELAETRESAMQVGFEANGFYGSAYVFNGDIDENGEDSHINNFGTNAGYTLKNDDFFIEISASYINNILDSDGLGDFATGSMEDNSSGLDKYVDGFAAHAIFSMGPIMVIGEYVTALDEAGFINEDTGDIFKADEIAAWNAEIACAFDMAGKETTVAFAYQGTDNAEGYLQDIPGEEGYDPEGFDLPESRIVFSIGVGIYDGTTLAFEYAHDEFENDDEVDRITAQLAFEF